MIELEMCCGNTCDKDELKRYIHDLEETVITLQEEVEQLRLALGEIDEGEEL